MTVETGGGGGDIGKINSHGGGDGGDDDGDDDDYFGDFDDGDEGDEGGFFRRRLVLQELFDRKFVDAVLQEWYKTMMDLPAGFRQAYEMGLFGKRMLADPSFLYKLLLEQAATIGCSVWWEFKNRKERIKQEWDLALINVLTLSACNAFVVWSLAPCRSYGNTFKFDLQNTIQKLPNNIFEKSYPLREFDLQKRIQSFFYKAAELCMVGLTAGAAQGALSNLLASKKGGRLSVTIPTVRTNALGYGAFLALYANTRYQLLCGIDRAIFYHFDVLGVVLFFSTALRVMNIQLGETSRLAWLGVEADPLSESDLLSKAHSRQLEVVADGTSSKWFISKNTIVSGLGLLGIKQDAGDSNAPPKARRKRIVKKKVVVGEFYTTVTGGGSGLQNAMLEGEHHWQVPMSSCNILVVGMESCNFVRMKDASEDGDSFGDMIVVLAAQYCTCLMGHDSLSMLVFLRVVIHFCLHPEPDHD
ncbi:hypothetical protein ACLOJK_025313 [Asimina triloba]